MVIKKIKRSLALLGICTCILSSGLFTTNAYADYYYANGNISFYKGMGLTGSDGKILDTFDCAAKIGVDVPPEGTPMYVHDLTNGIQETLYKWDTGYLAPSVILDIQSRCFVGWFEHLESKGYFHGEYYHY